MAERRSEVIVNGGAWMAMVGVALRRDVHDSESGEEATHTQLSG
jgi:hypothetical protein